MWSPGCEGNWRVTAALGPPGSDHFRLAKGSIRVEGDGLHVVSYDSLTMAAQFSDVPVPPAHERENLIRLPRGLYTCTVRAAPRPEGRTGAKPSSSRRPLISGSPSSRRMSPCRPGPAFDGWILKEPTNKSLQRTLLRGAADLGR